MRLYYQQIGRGTVVLIPIGLYLSEDFKRLANERTMIFSDVRNRGLSDEITDYARLERGTLNDVDDLEAVRLYFNLSEIDLIGHAYIGFMIVLYSLKYGRNLRRMVQLGPMQADAGKEYPSHLAGKDSVLSKVVAKLSQLQKDPVSADPRDTCENFW